MEQNNDNSNNDNKVNEQQMFVFDENLKTLLDRLARGKTRIVSIDLEFQKFKINQPSKFQAQDKYEIKESMRSFPREIGMIILEKTNNITAIFTMRDFMAFGAYRYCKQNSIKIPDEISIISIDDIYTSSIITPSLTTMAQQKYEMGFNAANLIFICTNSLQLTLAAGYWLLASGLWFLAAGQWVESFSYYKSRI